MLKRLRLLKLLTRRSGGFLLSETKFSERALGRCLLCSVVSGTAAFTSSGAHTPSSLREMFDTVHGLKMAAAVLSNTRYKNVINDVIDLHLVQSDIRWLIYITLFCFDVI